MTERVWVVVPTYQEAENVVRIVPAICETLETVVPGDFHVLVVDDNSPDGTGKLASDLSHQHPQVSVLHRDEKEGLGRAYVAGFRAALDRGAEKIIQMDADFSHDPKYLPEMLACAQHADVVIGSRYVRGGGVENWGLARRAISRGGSIYARAWLGVGVHDLTGGFKCLDRKVLQQIDLEAVRAHGYVFQIEVTYRAILGGFVVREIPIMFPDRCVGASKMSWKIATEATVLVPKMRFTSRRR